MGLPALAADYFFMGPLIKARLEDQVPDIPVDLCETADQVLAADRRVAVLMVMWAGDRFVDTEGGRASAGASQSLHQRWLVALGINNVGAGDARNVRAGPTISKVHKALAGWTAEGAARPLRRANAALMPQFTPQKAIYPMGFEQPLTL